MSGKRPKGIFQDRYNKPDSAIPPMSETLFYRVQSKYQWSIKFDNIIINEKDSIPFFNIYIYAGLFVSRS
jgi:hypothetical protein